MSEYQFVHFLAVDGPVEEKELGFMRRQSSRAEISPWEFTNEYHFGDFHGDARRCCGTDMTCICITRASASAG